MELYDNEISKERNRNNAQCNSAQERLNKCYRSAYMRSQSDLQREYYNARYEEESARIDSRRW